VSEFPSSSGFGNPVQKELKFRDGEKIVDIYPLKREQGPALSLRSLAEGDMVTIVTEQGLGCRTRLAGVGALKRNGKRVAKIRDGDAVVAVLPHSPQYALITAKAQAVRLDADEFPEREGASLGVTMIGVKGGDSVVGVSGQCI
jgi:DNA gyrase/topoisomerase IV subunit A